MKNLIYYFTGTGNSLSVAKLLQQKLDGETILRPIAQYVGEEKVIVEAADTVGFVFPIYGGDAPWPVKAVVEKMTIEGNPYLFAIGTCNERGGCCMDLFGGLLKRLGYTLSYGKKIDMPGNCMESNAGENAERLELEDFRVSIFAKNINNRFVGSCENFDSPENNAAAGKARFEGTPFAVWHIDEEKCTSCGLCEKLCPMDNIHLESGTPVFGDNCAFCFGCFHWCPQKAIYKDFGKLGKENSRSRYHHPDVTFKEIAAQKKQG